MRQTNTVQYWKSEQVGLRGGRIAHFKTWCQDLDRIECTGIFTEPDQFIVASVVCYSETSQGPELTTYLPCATGAGGQEASLFAAEIFQMYQR